MRSATFRNIALGILALAAAYHLGARTAIAQTPGYAVVAVEAGGYAYTANGDVYFDTGASPARSVWTFAGNVFAGGPTPAQRESFGALKSRYRGQRGAIQPATQDR